MPPHSRHACQDNQGTPILRRVQLYTVKYQIVGFAGRAARQELMYTLICFPDANAANSDARVFFPFGSFTESHTM
jgi:hypothetical protein